MTGAFERALEGESRDGGPGTAIDSISHPSGGSPVTSRERQDHLETSYRDAVRLIEVLKRKLLDVVSDELRIRGERKITAVQALLLFKLGEDELPVGDLRTRGRYYGANVSHTSKKMITGGYLQHRRSQVDCRVVFVRLTVKGMAIHDMLKTLFQAHLGQLGGVGDVEQPDLNSLNLTLKRLDRFWIDQVRFQL